MKKEPTLEVIEAQLAVIFRKLSDMEHKAAGSSFSTFDPGLYYLKKLREEAQQVVALDQNE